MVYPNIHCASVGIQCVQIRNILKQGIETPEDQNDLRKMQLRELARLNGTLREDDNRWALVVVCSHVH